MKRALILLVACGPAPVAAPPVSNQMEIVVLDAAPADALVLDVRAVRWSCAIKHPRNVDTNELRVPVGRAIKLVVWTPEGPPYGDGIAVALGGTVKPVRLGQRVEVAFRIDKPGTYEWKCPTIASPGGEDPVKPLIAMAAADYDAFIAAETFDDPANRIAFGKKVYGNKGCMACHTLDGSPRIGPSWAGIWGTQVTLADGSTRLVDAAYVKASIMTPQAFARPMFPPSMPSFEGQLRDRELDALVELIESLRDVKPAP